MNGRLELFLNVADAGGKEAVSDESLRREDSSPWNLVGSQDGRVFYNEGQLI